MPTPGTRPMGALVTLLRCVTCGAEYDPRGDHPLTCPVCGLDRGTLDYEYDLPQLAADWAKPEDIHAGIGAWLPILPISSAGSLPPLPLGPTPLIHATRLAAHLGIKALRLKLDSMLPSASLKDRASALALAHAKERGVTIIVAASTGNAASSLATLAASSGQKAVLLVPADAPPAKLCQIAMHGGILVPLKTSYDHAFDLSMELAAREGWYVRSTAVNPVLSEGKKTSALETTFQLDWNPRDPWFVSVGDGCIFGSFYKGLRELKTLGWIAEMPPLFGVQASGAAPLANCWEQEKKEITPLEEISTYADSIAVGHPRDWVKALRAARESHGQIIAAPDDLIRDAASMLAKQAGVLAEPAAAASLAGLLILKEEGRLGRDDSAVIFITGHGLKDQAALTQSVTFPDAIAPDPCQILQFIKSAIT